MAVAAELIGRALPGVKHKGSWVVTERLIEPPDVVGYSKTYGYKVKHESGRQAFLKAVDADLVDAEEEGSLAVRLQAVLMHHQFEAQVSDHCRGNNMDHVTLAIDHGSTLIELNGVKEPVFYLVFELANGDVRSQVLLERDWPVEKKFRLLHHVAVGLSQLHGARVSHNDLKPPNILQFPDGHRISDLGQATRDDMVAPHDFHAVVGDPRYAAPETLYSTDGEPGTRLFSNDSRKAGDLYLLGSIVHFLFAGRMLTPEVIDALSEAHLPPTQEGGWHGTFQELLPYWRFAFTDGLTRFREHLEQNGDPQLAPFIDDLVRVMTELCEPDPSLRGHPSGSRRTTAYSLQYYVSLFDRLAKSVQ